MGGAAAVKVALLCPASSVEVECGSTTVSAFGVSAGTGATHVARIEAAAARLRDCCATARARIPHRILAAASTAVLAGGCPISHACAGPAQQQQAGSIASKHAVDDPASSSCCWTLLALAGSGLCLLVRVSDWLQPCGLPCCLLLLPEASSSWLPVAWPGQWGSGIRRSSFTIELVRRASMPSA
jgi:hypothetical protein